MVKIDKCQMQFKSNNHNYYFQIMPNVELLRVDSSSQVAIHLTQVESYVQDGNNPPAHVATSNQLERLEFSAETLINP